jgi:hypothetical protein
MKKYLWLTVSFAVLVGWMATPALARGHGEGHRAEGHRAEGHHADGEHHNTSGEHHAAWQAEQHHPHANIPSHFEPSQRPFTPAWYADHPNAWGYGNVNNYWAGAPFGAATAWLGYSAAAAANPGLSTGNTTVYTGDANPDFNDQAAQDTEPTTGEVVSPAAQAAALAASGLTELPSNADFLPLGVYSLAQPNQPEASAMLQLAVSKEGLLRGSYYDVLSGQEHAIAGSIDKNTQRVAWSVAPNNKVFFETSLQSLTNESGPVAVHFENGESRQWTLARYDSAESSEELPEEAGPAANEGPSNEPRPESSDNVFPD